MQSPRIRDRLGPGLLVSESIDIDIYVNGQTVTLEEALQCPNDAKRSDKGTGYKSVAAGLL